MFQVICGSCWFQAENMLWQAGFESLTFNVWHRTGPLRGVSEELCLERAAAQNSHLLGEITETQLFQPLPKVCGH